MDTLPSHPERTTPTWTPWFVLVLGLILTGAATLYVSATTRDRDAMRFEQWVRESVRGIQERIDTYIALLRGGAAFFAASEDVTRRDFAAYVQRLRLDDLYPGIQGIGFSRATRHDELDRIEADLQAQGAPAFRIWPEDPPRPWYYPIVFLEPEDRRNLRAVGFDMFTETSRRQAMVRAMETGLPALSGPVTLVQEIDPEKQTGFTLYVPVYEDGELPPPELRAERLRGFIYSPFRAEDLLNQIFQDDTRALMSIRVYDTGELDEASLLYASTDSPLTQTPRFVEVQRLMVGGREWTLRFASRPAYERMLFSRMAVPATLAGGIGLSLVLFGVTMSQAMAQVRAQRTTSKLVSSERALRETEEHLRMALAAAQLYAFAIDADSGRVSHIGDARQVLGRKVASQDEFVAMVHPDDRPVYEQSLARAMANEGTHELTYRLVDAAGETHWLRDIAVVQFDNNGSARRMVGITADVTQQKLTEHMLRQFNETLEQRVADRTLEAEQRSAQLRALANELTQAEQRERRRLAQVLHDHLQQLLVASLMRMAALRRKADDGMREPLDSLEDLIRQAIASSRSLTIELSPPVLYDAGLGKAIEWLARSMKEKHGLTVHVHEDPDEPPLNEDLRAFLFQATRELLFNIVKHAGVSEATVVLERHDGAMSIRVEDRGPGFDPSVLKVKGAKAEHFGLFSIQQRLELLGGQMSVESSPGEGTRITLRTPIITEGEASEHVSEILADLPESDEHLIAEKLLSAYTTTSDDAIRVLLADDHEVLRQGLGAILHTQQDIDLVGEASDGEAVVRMARELKPDVVVMDVTMPRLNGVEATRRILAHDPRVRIIGLSVHDHAALAEAMLEAGAHAYLNKTGPAEELLTAIRHARSGSMSPQR